MSKQIRYQTFPADTPLTVPVVFGEQTHSTRIARVQTGQEDLAQTDGLITDDPQLLLGVKTADCAPIVFIGSEQFGIVHAGWRGLVDGIIEKMLTEFDEMPQTWIGPLYPVFEIQRDACYERIHARFGERFFREHEGRLEFRFLDAICSIIPQADYCGRSTYADPTLASWRRDKILARNNITLVGALPAGLVGEG